VRIGRIARDLMGGEFAEILIEFDPNGSLATTHDSQGSDMGLCGGFLGWQATDEQLVGSVRAIQEAGVKVRIEISGFGAEHPNTYRLSLKNTTEQHAMTAVSTGGGMIEVTEIDSVRVSIAGDYYETLIYLDSGGDEVLEYLAENATADQVLLLEGTGARIVEVKAQSSLDEQILSALRSRRGVRDVKMLSPVLPVLSHEGVEVPFITCEDMLKFNQDKGLDLWELAVHYESARGNLTHDEIFERMRDVVRVMRRSIHEGIAGTEYADRILGYQSGRFQDRMKNGRLLDGGILNRIILYVTALMEVKSSMGVIVAAPTAGACGGLPGAVVGAAHAMGLSGDDAIRAMLAAGLIGVFIAAHATFAAEVGGCQAECGAGSGMAAAALVTLGGGTTQQAIDAASMALQNVFGMVCDPVANRVEVPCLGKNVLAASNALACANMALAGFDAVIPLDEVIDAMDAVGKSLPHELRCTALGGLSTTRASQEIKARLDRLRAD
jgi:L-serine dehydratase